VFVLSPLGVRTIREFEVEPLPPPEYRERAIFLGHDLLTQEVRVELVQHAREQGKELTRWETGPSVIVGVVRPDAVFNLPPPKRDSRGILEADRGSEVREVWLKKQEKYTGLFTGETLYQTIGFGRGWVLAVTETVSRAPQLTGWMNHERIRVMPIGTIGQFVGEFGDW